MFKQAWSGSLGTAEKLSSKSQVETAGYISAEKRIINLIQAGQRLKDFRTEQFDFKDDKSVDLDFHDPTRDPGFDLADAFQLECALADKKQAEELAKAEAEATKIVENPVKDEKPTE